MKSGSKLAMTAAQAAQAARILPTAEVEDRYSGNNNHRRQKGSKRLERDWNALELKRQREDAERRGNEEVKRLRAQRGFFLVFTNSMSENSMLPLS